MEVGCGILRGLGKSITSTVISLVCICIFRVLWISTVFNYVFATVGASEPMTALAVIYLSFPISWVLSGAIFLYCSLRTIKKLIRAQSAELSQPVCA